MVAVHVTSISTSAKLVFTYTHGATEDEGLSRAETNTSIRLLVATILRIALQTLLEVDLSNFEPHPRPSAKREPLTYAIVTAWCMSRCGTTGITGSSCAVISYGSPAARN